MHTAKFRAEMALFSLILPTNHIPCSSPGNENSCRRTSYHLFILLPHQHAIRSYGLLKLTHHEQARLARLPLHWETSPFMVLLNLTIILLMNILVPLVRSVFKFCIELRIINLRWGLIKTWQPQITVPYTSTRKLCTWDFEHHEKVKNIEKESNIQDNLK